MQVLSSDTESISVALVPVGSFCDHPSSGGSADDFITIKLRLDSTVDTPELIARAISDQDYRLVLYEVI